MDLLREVCDDPAPPSRLCRVINPENYRHVDLPVTKELTTGDVIARARARGLRDYRDRVTLAVQNDELRTTLGRLFSRDDVDHWIDAELAIDIHEDLNTISLSQARALAREAGVDNYSMAVLNAITRLEIEGVEYRRGRPLIPIAAFEAWLEAQGVPFGGKLDQLAGEDQIRLDPELLALVENPRPPSGWAVAWSGIKLYWWQALVVLVALRVIGFVLGG